MSPPIRVARLTMQLARTNRVTHDDQGRVESVADHTVMLGVLAVAYAAKWSELNLDPGRVAVFALVHDLVEARAGDTNTIGITGAQAAEKEAREREAFKEIDTEFADLPAIGGLIDRYERQDTPEARFVRYMDKVCPKLCHALNVGVSLEALGVSLDALKADHAKQQAELAARYPEFAGTVGVLLTEACNRTEATYERRVNDQRTALRTNPVWQHGRAAALDDVRATLNREALRLYEFADSPHEHPDSRREARERANAYRLAVEDVELQLRRRL